MRQRRQDRVAWHIPPLLQALLDLSCYHTLVHQCLVPPEAIDRLTEVGIQCVHWDVHYYPTARIEFLIVGKMHNIVAGVSTCSPLPLILGHDWSGFREAERGKARLKLAKGAPQGEGLHCPFDTARGEVDTDD